MIRKPRESGAFFFFKVSGSILSTIHMRFERLSVIDFKMSYPIGVLLLLGAVLFPASSAYSADFQVAVKRLSVPQCTLTGSMLNIDPSTGNVSIDLSTDLACYPAVVNSIANGASLSINGATTVGGGTTGAGTVNVQLNTGLSAITPGVSCVTDGFTSNNVSVSTGWTGTLCGPNCGATVTRSVDVQNTSATLDGSITFKAKCTYQDQANVNLTTVRANIQSTPAVSVLHGTAPPANFCQSVSELSDPKGLTDGMRQTSGNIVGGTLPGTNISFLNYVSVFGVSSNTYPSGSGDTAGFGFPGPNTSTISTFITRDRYVSMQFRAPSNPVWLGRTGYYSFVVNPQNLGFSAAVAPCPGQFESDPLFPIPTSCKGEALFQDINWVITSGSTVGCKLEPGKTYYFNMIHAPAGSPSQASCPSSSCKIEMRNAHSF